MSHEEERETRPAEDVRDFEERLRELLVEDAYAIHPSPAPCPEIRRRGVAERRRRIAVAGAALATLAVVPVGAYALTGGNGGRGADLATSTPSVSAPRTPSATPSGPRLPASPLQLLDGITSAQAAEGLELCLAFDRDSPGVKNHGGERDGLGDATEYRVLLAMKATGDSNTPGDGYFVVAVREKSGSTKQTRLICALKDGEVSGLNGSTGDSSDDGAGPVVADINSGKLYQQSVIDRGTWKLPFRWGIIGTFEPSVAEVTVSYGDSSTEAVLDHGWFVAAGTLNRQVTVAPHIKGYDSSGKLVYDSDEDKTYQRTLP